MLDDTLFELSRQLVGQLLRQQRRQLGDPLGGRRHLLTGPRGVGKSTWTAQYLADKYPDYGRSTGCLYLPADHFLLAGRSLYELAEVFVRRGGRLLCLDEVHRADHWSRDLKSLADTFPQLEILATGSSLLHLRKGSHDLSRRFLVHSMEGLSFREYLQLKHGLSLPVLPLPDLLADHQTHTASLPRQLAETGAPVLKHFQEKAGGEKAGGGQSKFSYFSGRNERFTPMGREGLAPVTQRESAWRLRPAVTFQPRAEALGMGGISRTERQRHPKDVRS